MKLFSCDARITGVMDDALQTMTKYFRKGFAMRYLELCEDAPQAQEAVPAKVYYHVTTKHRLKKIEQNGVEPNHNRRWRNGFGKKLGERGYIYMMSDLKSAIRWAARMEWDEYQGKPPVPSHYLIVAFRADPAQLEPDPHIENGLTYGNTWFRKQGGIDPSQIVKIIPLTPALIKQVVNDTEPVTEGMMTQSIWSPSKTLKALAAKDWYETEVENMFVSDECPGFSIDLDIHHPEGPFGVYFKGRRLETTKVVPTPRLLRLKDPKIRDEVLRGRAPPLPASPR